MSETKFDLIVIGAGPGGYVAAIRAAQLGLKTAIIEREHLGGICLNWGCIPTKALLRTSEIKHYLDNAADFGLSVKEVGFDLKKVVARSRKVAGQLNTGVKGLLKKNKVTTIMGEAKLKGKGKITVKADGKTTELQAKDIILATGARARELPHLKADGKLVWTYKHAMTPEVMPKSLLVVGSGAIGVEFASFYRDMGAEVTIIEMMDRVLPVEDEDVSAFAKKQFEKQGMKIVLGASVEKIDTKSECVTAHIKGKDGKTTQLTVDRMILAIGITGNVENLGLEEAGVKVDRGHVVADEWGRTGVDGIWAIGDISGPPCLPIKPAMKGSSPLKKSPVSKAFTR
ncbi:hypothetical protein JCM17843_24140 [Kordiimonadales bacterium JCM 17843]|nr:hypothetical protein JCM17843_24140 [Kordiimonadales bacterium JCM 17843]